jgi:hypothetical protein
MKKSDNVDHDCEETPPSDPTEAIPEANSSYYYDDATGYEIFKDDEDESESGSESEDRSI